MHIKNYLYLLMLIFLFAQCATLKNATSGTFKDKRDGQTYKWVRLKDGKKWMAQNLNYEMEGARCCNEKSGNCEKYGLLYTWEAALQACPSGWHLPTDKEWWNMVNHYKDTSDSTGTQEISQEGYAGEVTYRALTKKDNSEFSAQLAGFIEFENCYDHGKNGNYWNSSEQSPDNAWICNFGSHGEYIVRLSFKKNRGLLSCRCLQD